MTLLELQRNTQLRIDRNCPGAFLWRLRPNPDGVPQEELISEGAPYQVFDAAFYFGVRNQKPCIFSHADLQALEGAYLLLDRGPKAARETKFVFESPNRIVTYTDVDYASINFFVYSGEDRRGIGLSFSLARRWTSSIIISWRRATARYRPHPRGSMANSPCRGWIPCLTCGELGQAVRHTLFATRSRYPNSSICHFMGSEGSCRRTSGGPCSCFHLELRWAVQPALSKDPRRRSFIYWTIYWPRARTLSQ